MLSALVLEAYVRVGRLIYYTNQLNGLCYLILKGALRCSKKRRRCDSSAASLTLEQGLNFRPRLLFYFYCRPDLFQLGLDIGSLIL
jgi:hypothetical protein